MNAKVIHLRMDGKAVALSCETGDYRMIDLKQPGQLAKGDSVGPQRIWLEEWRKILNQRTQRDG